MRRGINYFLWSRKLKICECVKKRELQPIQTENPREGQRMNRGREGAKESWRRRWRLSDNMEALTAVMSCFIEETHTHSHSHKHPSVQPNFIFIHDQTLVRTLLSPADTRTCLLSLETAGGQWRTQEKRESATVVIAMTVKYTPTLTHTHTHTLVRADP